MLIEAGQQLMSIGNDCGRDVRTLIALGLIAYDELWRLYIAPKLKDQSLNV